MARRIRLSVGLVAVCIPYQSYSEMTFRRNTCSAQNAERPDLQFPVQGTNALSACRIICNVETLTECCGPIAVEHLQQRVPVCDAADRSVKEAWPYGSVRFNNGRNPRRIAEWRYWLCQADASSKSISDSSQLLRRFRDKAAAILLANERFNLRIQ